MEWHPGAAEIEFKLNSISAAPGCHSIKSYEHYRFKKHCIKELRTVLKCQKVFVNDIILRPLGSPL